MQEIEYDPVKRRLTLQHRGLDMARADEVLEGPNFSIPDDRRDYGEPRIITAGFLDGRMVVLVWTPRGAVRRVISLRRANVREIAKYRSKLG
jgi:uncharacterized DUF497 family protein